MCDGRFRLINLNWAKIFLVEFPNGLDRLIIANIHIDRTMKTSSIGFFTVNWNSFRERIVKIKTYHWRMRFIVQNSADRCVQANPIETKGEIECTVWALLIVRMNVNTKQ